MRTIARYPELKPDGSMYVPNAPPPAPTYEPITADSTGLSGRPAAVSTAPEWIVDLRVLSDPFLDSDGRWYVRLCSEGAWFDFDRHTIPPKETECRISSVRLVFVLRDQ